MKNFLIIFIIALSISVLLYQNNAHTLTIRNHVGNETLNEQQIIEDITQNLSRLVTGIVERDAKLIFSIFSDPVKARYIKDGAIYKNIPAAEKDYARTFKKQDHSITRTFEFVDQEYDIISSSTVLFTGIGELHEEKSIISGKPWVIAYTILWVLDADGWKAMNMHISYE